MGKTLGMSERGITKIIGRLIKAELVIKEPTTKYLKTSQEWYNKVVYINENNTDGTKFPSDTEQRSHQTRNNVPKKPGYDNNIDNNIDIASSPSSPNGVGEKPMPAEFKNTIGYLRKLPEKDIETWIKKFPVLTRENIIRESERADSWLAANGRRQKNYKAFLRNWLDNSAERLKNKGGKNGGGMVIRRDL